MTLADLLEELESLDPDEKEARFIDIVAELVNHVGELELGAMASSLVWVKRAALARVIGRTRREADLPLLVRLLGDAHEGVLLAAIAAAGTFRRGELVAPLAASVGTGELSVTLAALGALGKIGDAAALPAVVGALGADVPAIRQAAVKTVEKIGDARAIVALLPLRKDIHEGTRVAAIEVLGTLCRAAGPLVLDAELEALGEPGWRAVLADLDATKVSIPPLREALGRLAATSVDADALAGFGRVIVPGAATFGREAILGSIEEIIDRPAGRSFVLAGERGVGKTNLVHALARRLAARPKPWLVLETSTAEVMVGTKYIGEWETRLADLVNKTRAPRRVILYFTNVNDVPTAGTTSTNRANFLSMLAPYIRRGELVVAGEGTPAELARGLERDARGLFQIVKVPEPEPAETAAIIDRVVGEVGRQANVEIVVRAEVRELVSELAATYYAGLSEPGRSLRLIEDALEPRLEKPEPVLELLAEDVIVGLARKTGLPERLLNDKRPLDPAEVRAFFDERVLGQRVAVDAVVDLITLMKAGLNDPKKPLGVVLFVGPTGVGKTEIAKALAEYIFGSPDRMIRVDLSEYASYQSHERLLGTGGHEAGALTQKVRGQPFSVVLLDELEKAHLNVFDLFLQVFDDGRLTDGRGETVDFRHTMIVMTSNLGSRIDTSAGLGFGATGTMPSEEQVVKEVRKFFRPEFVNRLGRIVFFEPLSAEVMRKIVQRELGKVVLRSGILGRRLLVDVEPGVVDKLLAEGFSIEYGARPLKRRVEELVLLPLARAIVGLGPEDRGALLRVTVEDDRVVVRRAKPRVAAPPDERLRLKRPEDERPVTIKPADLPALLGALAARVARLSELAESGGLEERKSALVAQTGAPSFWDDPAAARRALGELVHLEGLIEALARVKKRTEDLDGFGKSYTRHGASLKSRFEHAYADLVDDLVEVEYRFTGERAEDRRDVFLRVCRIGSGRDAAEAAELLERMYTSWAERRGVKTTLLRRAADEHGANETLWLLEGGGALFGLLRAEEGLHRFEGGGKGADRRALYGRVEVAARPDGESRLARREVRIERSAAGVVAVHLPSATSVETAVDAGDAVVLELLEAELEARARRQPDDDRLVRRYGIEGRFVRDEDTGLRTGHKEIATGGLDEILRARRLPVRSGKLPPRPDAS